MSNSLNDLPMPLVAPIMIAFFIFIKVDKPSINANFLKFTESLNLYFSDSNIKSSTFQTKIRVN
jgi:hypothetical protein